MKYLFLLITAISFINISAFANTQYVDITQVQNQLQKLEKSFDGKIGVYAIDTNSNSIIAYRADEYFPVQSTSKLMDVAALLKQAEKNKSLLNQKITYTHKDLISYSPVTKIHVNDGLSLQALAEAAMTYSDNAAANLITKKLGGPKMVTSFARAIGNPSFNMEHYEGNLNSNLNNHEDSSTPKDMAMSLQKLTLGDVLTPSQQTQLVAWMRNNTTSYQRVRQATPLGWNVADKTGTGNYGIANDIGILWSPLCKPIVLSIYTARNKADAKHRDDIVASTTNIVMSEFAKNDKCFKELSS